MLQTDASTATSWSPKEESSSQHRETIVLVRWALIIACAYLVLFSEGSTGVHGLGLLTIAAFLGSNLLVGRLQPEVINTQRFHIGIAALDTVFIALSLYLAGQLQVELVVLCLGVLVLAIAGLRLGVIAGATLGMTGAYVLLVWLGGVESVWRSSMLLRVPFLLCAAIVYSWVTDSGRSHGDAEIAGPPSTIAAVAADLGLQLEAIKRCESAISAGDNVVRAALQEIARRNQEMQTKLAGGSAVLAKHVGHGREVAEATA